MNENQAMDSKEKKNILQEMCLLNHNMFVSNTDQRK